MTNTRKNTYIFLTIFLGCIYFVWSANTVKAGFDIQIAGTSTDSGTLRFITGGLGSQNQYQSAYLWQPSAYSIWCNVSYKVTKHNSPIESLIVSFAENGTTPSNATIFDTVVYTSSTVAGSSFLTHTFRYCRNAPPNTKNWIIFTTLPDLNGWYDLHVGNQNASATALGWYSLSQVADIWTTSTNELLGSINGTDNPTDTAFYASSTDGSFSYFETPVSSTTINICAGYEPVSVQGALCNIFSFLFVPSTSIIQQYTNTKTTLATKVPWGWWTQVSAGFGSVSSTITASTTAFTLQIPFNGATETIAIIDYSEMNKYIPQSLLNIIRALGGVAIWAMFGAWIWHLVTGSKPTDENI